ncbi:hypothetical protein HPB50_001734 [Hyalomma asiaticum]|uniref:Uncharacterized protein n=1 Tax=Hyalomma asiaticum TaxID=266040 RepID=A0ACB7RP77_HYAAI|nr:hypothetical protein HPB50_001734 [Hyalomma asiaticum]
MTSSKSPNGALCKRYNTTSTNFVTVLEGLNRFEAYTVFVSAYTTHQGVAIVGNTEKTFVTIDPAPKLTVDGLQVEAITNDSLRISWTGVDLSASRWRALYRVKVILKSTGEQVFEKEVATTEVVFADFKNEEYSIQIEACIVRGGVQNCGKPNSATFSRSALVQDKHQVTIQTINSTAIAVTLTLQGATEPHLDGFKISWAPSKRYPNDTSHEKSSIVLLPSNSTGFVIANLDSFKAYDVRVTKIYSEGISHWETVASRSETVTDPKPFPKPSGVAYKSSSSGGKSSLVLSWNAPITSSEPPTEGYIVSICPRDELQETTGGCQTYNTSSSFLKVEVSGLRSFTEYTVEITAYATINGRVVKGESIRKVVVTSPPPIPTIENPVVSNSVEGTSVNISWTRPDSLTDYDIAYEVALIEEASGLVLSKEEVNISETTLQGLEASTEYTVTIIVCLVRGTEKKCGNATTLLFKTTSKDAPNEPIHVHIKAVNSSALLVTWLPPSTNVTPVDGYVITWWKENETFPEEVSTETKSLPADMTSFVISRLEANTTYHISVSRLYQGSRPGRVDTEVTSASTQPDPYLKPQGLRVEYMSNASEVTVTWDTFPVRTEDSPVRGYTVNLCVLVENDTGEDLQDCDERQLSAGIEKVVFTGVNTLTDYRVEVKAIVRQLGNGTVEGQPAFFRLHTPGPPVPDLRSTLRADINATSAALFWRGPVGFDEYEVLYYISVSSASSEFKVERTTNLTEQIFEGLEPGTNYSADVATCLVRRKRWHCAGNTTIQFKTLPVGFQGDVRNFTAEAVNGTAAQLSWDAPGVREDLTGYRLSWWLYDTNHSRKAHSSVSTVPFNRASAIIDRLEPYTTYAIEVTAEYEVGDVTWRGSPLLQIVTTKPDGLPFVKDVHIATTNRTTLSSDVVISWTTTSPQSSAVQVEYHVILCVGSNASAHDCRNQSAKAPTSRVVFPGVKNFATLVAAVESLVKTENNIFKGPKVVSTDLSWAPDISGLNGLTVRDVTENSALVSWSKVQDFDEINGAYYNVVLIVRATRDATGNDEFSGAGSQAPQNGSVPTEQRIIVRNATTSAASIELSNLKPWTNYTVAVTPTVAGEGQVFVGNIQSKDFTTLVGAPEKPRNVTVEELEDGHLLRWLPPSFWNGPPGGYEVSLTCTNGEVKGIARAFPLNQTGRRFVSPSSAQACLVQ